LESHFVARMPDDEETVDSVRRRIDMQLSHESSTSCDTRE
jgi:hypothetical protein